MPGQVFSGAAATNSGVSLSIAGHTVTPSFAGLVQAGLYQINLSLPANLGSKPMVASMTMLSLNFRKPPSSIPA
jgi:uncharacterized protein (TIGR03437 family)